MDLSSSPADLASVCLEGDVGVEEAETDALVAKLCDKREIFKLFFCEATAAVGDAMSVCLVDSDGSLKLGESYII